MVKRPANIPTNPGIYIFRRGAKLLYVGKAANIRKRLVSYFRKPTDLSPKIQKMLREATNITFEKTASEVEALIREAELIKKFQPRYNVLMRDDKNYSFVGITREPYPRIFVTHQPREQKTGSRKRETGRKRREASRTLGHLALTPKPYPLFPIPYPLSPRYIGPFTSASELHATLKMLRRIFPYCTCRRPHKRPCLNAQIGRCLGFCCADAASSRPRPGRALGQLPATSKDLRQYRNNIRSIITVLSGNRTRLTAHLKRAMAKAAKQERYEAAARLRDEIFGLESVFSHRAAIRGPRLAPDWSETESRLQILLGSDMPIQRIEGYDISNISGTAATGSMVVFTYGRPDKSQYRKFRIKTVEGPNDVGMHGEVLRRRFRHAEWPFPQLIVMDGGKPQLNAARIALEAFRKQDPRLRHIILSALAKREEILFTESGKTVRLSREHPTLFNLFRFVRDESHRFAQAYHHKLRQRAYAR